MREVSKHIGGALRLARYQKGYTQSQVAEKFGISRTTYTGYELGSITMPYERMIELCAYLGVTIPENELGLAECSNFPTRNKIDISEAVDKIENVLLNNAIEKNGKQVDLADVKSLIEVIKIWAKGIE